MIAPVIPAILVLGGAGFIAYKALSDKKLPTGGLKSVPGDVDVPAAGSPLPAEYKAAINTLLAAPFGDPVAYELLASKLDELGYKPEALALRNKAAELRGKPAATPSVPSVPSIPSIPSIPSVPSVPNVPAPQGVIPVPPPPSAVVNVALPTGNPLLRRGSSGPDVMKWQGFLVYMGYNDVAVDGAFGPITETATKAFQKSKGLTADGIVGPKSVEAAKASLPTATTSGVLISGSGALGPRQVQCLAPNGCWLRATPHATAKKLGHLPYGVQASLLTYAKGSKANASAPGPGGWAHVSYGGTRAWVPAEWLRLGA